MSTFGYRNRAALAASGGQSAARRRMMARGAAVSAKAARARAYAAIRNSITPMDLAPRNYVPSALGLARASAKMELKGVDTPIGSSNNPIVDTTGTNANAFCLNLVEQGTGSFNRIGRKIHMQSLRLMGAAQCINANVPTTATTLQGPLRMVVVLDRQPNGGNIPTWDTIFGYTDSTGTEASTVFSPLKYDNMDRFKVLKDCILEADRITYVPDAEGTDNFCAIEVYFDEYIKLPNIETVYGSSSNPPAITDITTGSLLLFFRTNINLTKNYWNVKDASIARLRFRD